MALEDDIEPVCVEGIEAEAAIDRCRGLGCISKADYRMHWAGRKMPGLCFAFGGFLLPVGTPLFILLGAVEIAGGVYFEWDIRKQQRDAVGFLEYGTKSLIYKA